MVAYSFKRRFVDPIKVGLGVQTVISAVRPKLQTIRADRRRHARPGEELQLYFGMRTKQCTLIGRARCIEVCSIILTFEAPACVAICDYDDGHCKNSFEGKALDEFARTDGFNNWGDMIEFWHAEHLEAFEQGSFPGVIIFWEPLAAAEAKAA